MDFDLATSFLSDHELADFVELARLETQSVSGEPTVTDGLHARRENINTTEFQAIAAGLSLSSSAAAFVVWPPLTEDTQEPIELEIQQGAVLRFVTEEEAEEVGEGWIVQAYERSRFGHYVMLCDREVTNAPAGS